MSVISGLEIPTQVTDAARPSANTKGQIDAFKFMILKVSDDEKSVALDEVSDDPDYEVFRTKLESPRDNSGKPIPRFAIYNVNFELPGEGKRLRPVLITWAPQDSPIRYKMVYASTQEALKTKLDIHRYFIHADSKSDIEWKAILAVASDGKIK